MPTTRTPEVLRQVILDRTDRSGECWVWTAGTDGTGYGMMKATAIAPYPIRAHRVSYAVFVDEQPHGTNLHHICGNTLCVNPQHLALLTPSDHGHQHHGFTKLDTREARAAVRREHRHRTRVPCSHGCGAMVDRPARNHKPPECRECSIRRINEQGLNVWRNR